MRNIVGSPVEGDDFFGREEDVDWACRTLRDGNHLLLLAPRRVGKTSLAKRVGNRLQQEDWRFAWCDVQGATNEMELLSRLLEGIREAGIERGTWETIGAILSAIPRAVKGKYEHSGLTVEIAAPDGSGPTTPLRLLENLLERVTAGDERLVIGVDELPIFLAGLEKADRGPERVRAFLNSFRALRTRFHRQVRWFLLGSVGLDTFVEARKLVPTTNDLTAWNLGAFPEPTAIRFLQRLGDSYQMVVPEAACRAVLAAVGWPLPFYLQIVFSRLHYRHSIQPGPITEQAVAEAIQELETPAYWNYFESWRGRLGEGLDPDQRLAARTILDALSRDGKGRTRAALQALVVRTLPLRDPEETRALLSTVLGQLERDGYLLSHSAAPGGGTVRYAFRSFLLRRYWYMREVR
ncbi:MAG: hypothetical protein FJX77_03935 [Armatimonadetes bacterium]|nr:hypothetical protein [Armatimonadota bacterium]